MNLQQQIAQIRGQYQVCVQHLGKLGTSINGLATLVGHGTGQRPQLVRGNAPLGTGTATTGPPTRRLSRTGRAKIAAAQKARWEKKRANAGPQPVGTKKAA